MNPRSFRFRLLLWYSLTIFFVAAIIFAGFYLVTREILFAQVDRELNLHAATLAEIASRQGINMHEAMLKQQLYQEFSDIPGMVVVLLDENGSVVRSSLATSNPYVAFNHLYQQARDNSGAVYLNENVDNTPLRFIGVPIQTNDNFLGVVLVAHPVEAIQNSLNTLSQTLAVIFGLLIVPLGIYFNRLLERIAEAINRERQFIGDVAHELKTPLSTLRGGIELALSKKRSIEEYRGVLNETMIDVNRLSRTITNVLDLAWLESENAALRRQRFNLSNTLNDLAEIAQKLASQKNIKIKAAIASGVYLVGSEEKIARAVLNIIDNAIKFTPKSKSIFISLKKVKRRIEIVIKDVGVGVPENELPHIFERFYRGETKVKTYGSGLGLAIAKGIINAHEGEVNITSRVGQGTCVTIIL
jgi:signal transduction histidine kinase